MMGFGLREGAKLARALVSGVRGNGVGEICGFGARARRKRKNVEIGERKSRDETHGGGVILVGFAGESDNDVGADGGVRKRFANKRNTLRVMRGAIPAMHGAKNAVGA